MNQDNKPYDVRISVDGYKAYFTLSGNAVGFRLSFDKMLDILKENNVTFGIKEDVIHKIVEIHKTRSLKPNILIAEGMKPLFGKDAKIIFPYKPKNNKLDDLAAKAETKDIQKYCSVKKKQVLAIKTNKVDAVNGQKVTGEIEYRTSARDISLTAEKNVSIEKTNDSMIFKSDISGIVKTTEDKISVLDRLVINGDLGFATGNIRLPGEVLINGDVKPGFHLKAGKKIEIKGSVFASDIVSNDHIFIGDGVEGKNKGRIISKTGIKAKYVKNCYVMSRGGIEIENDILQSTVKSDKYIKINDFNSRVIGSKLKAPDFIHVNNAGSRTDDTSFFETGYIPSIEREYSKYNDLLTNLLKKSKKLEKKYGSGPLSEALKYPGRYTKEVLGNARKWDVYQKDMDEIKLLLKVNKEKMYTNDGYIIVKGRLFPGVKIKVGRYNFDIDKIYQNVKIFYSSEDQKIKVISTAKY